MNKIAIIEDDIDICNMIAKFLENNKYIVHYALNGAEGMELCKSLVPDLIILDIMLPKLNGNDVLQRLRKFTNAPVIVVSAKTMVQTKIDLLKLGADDYMTKPFDLHELLARIEANLKRTSNTSCQNDTLTYRDIEINNSLVYIKEVLVSFTSTELKILRLLLQYPQKIFSKQNLYESIWNETYAYDDDTINTHISHIRKKIKAMGIAAGESENPEKNIPRAVRQVFWRILLFYVFAILIISLIIPYTDPSLLRNDVKDISVSPFTLVFQHAGLLSAAAIMNAVILTAVLSAGNSGMYASTRMLYTLACDGKAPRIFSKLSRGGVPRNALYATTVIAALCFLTSMFGNQTVYLWLLNTSGMTGFIAWLGIAISHYRFRRGYVLQGNDINNLPYRSGFFPLGPIFAFVLCLIITLGQNYEAFLKDTIDWGGVAATYIGIPLFLVIWFGYKLAKGTRFVRYSEMTFPDRFKR